MLISWSFRRLVRREGRRSLRERPRGAGASIRILQLSPWKGSRPYGCDDGLLLSGLREMLGIAKESAILYSRLLTSLRDVEALYHKADAHREQALVFFRSGRSRPF